MGIGAGAAAGIAAGVGAAGSIASSAISSGAAGSASKSQQAAAQEAEAAQNAQWAYSQQQELPYIENGINADTSAGNLLGQYGSMVSPYLNALTGLGNSATAQAALAQTPGYQFTLGQGLQSTQNSNAAQGLGVSGAALKGAANYATGLADTTYQQQYNNALSNFGAANTAFNTQLSGQQNLASLGENAAVGAGSQGQAMSNNNSALVTGAGNAAAAGTVGSANALSSGIAGLGNSASSGFLLNNLLSNNSSLPSFDNNTGGGI